MLSGSFQCRNCNLFYLKTSNLRLNFPTSQQKCIRHSGDGVAAQLLSHRCVRGKSAHGERRVHFLCFCLQT